MKVLLIGFGTVAQGLAELLVEKAALLFKTYGIRIQVIGIADFQKGSLYNPRGLDLKKVLAAVKKEGTLAGLKKDVFNADALALIKKAKADVMCEATYTDIQTAEPATSHIRAALKQGMHVVTSNKGPLALHYHELVKLAGKKKRAFLFEGTVMSGTPVLNLIRETLAGSEVREIQGILNGTTNYILSHMEEGLPYEAVLKKAQELGYAEAIPDADVLGWDALAKVTILANTVFAARKKPFDYPCQGITHISAADIAAAKAQGKRFKLIGRVWKEGKTVNASVAPQQISLSHPLAGVMGAGNALTISSDTLGDVTIIGPGAGRRETGFSLLIDLIHIGRCRH